ncbi:MAG: MOSC N-terminal beta barrel domain-containing protein [Bacteroidota bacterium]
MRLKEIIIYPIKSLGGIHLKSNNLEQKGLQNDRRWMLVDKNNRFLTIRQYPKFLFFSLSINDTGFNISYESDHLEIPFKLEGVTEKAVVWDDEVEVVIGDKKWNDWFSKHLGIECKLVYLPDTSPRLTKKKWSKNEGNVSLADGYPILVAGEESLKELNGKLDQSITMARFRPNLVFDGGKPYEEYVWKNFTIGNVQFEGLKPCTRCVVTTYDEQTGEKGIEPLKTLNQQKIDNKMVFGQHVIAIDYLEIKVGDEINIDRYKDSPYDQS